MSFAPVYDARSRALILGAQPEKPRSQRFAADEKGKAVKT